MDRKNKRNEEAVIKNDYRIKDRGDLKKCNDKNLRKSEGITQMNINLAYPECGDSLRKESVVEKNKLKNPKKEETKMKYLSSGTNEKELLNKNNYYDMPAKSHSELRKRIRDRYTVKLNGPVYKSEHTSLYTSKKADRTKVAALETNRNKRDLPLKPISDPAERPEKHLSEETTQTVEKSIHSSVTSAKINTDSKPDRMSDKNAEKVPVKKKRKPIIRTITSKNNPVRIFKAVHFVEQRNTTPLEIKIPGSIVKKQQKFTQYTETSSLKFKPKLTVSKASSNKQIFKEEKLSKLAAVRKRAEKRRERNFRRGQSPHCTIREPPSPPTEVARWAPASAEPQTIPYYEAWINTTLATISKTSKQDKLAYEKQAKLLRSFQKALDERPESPELFYAKFADEKYTGRIKIRQKDRIQKKQKVFTFPA